jgi:hypothetical protein
LPFFPSVTVVKSKKIAPKSSCPFANVNSRLRGRSEIGQQLIFPEKVDRTVDYVFKS